MKRLFVVVHSLLLWSVLTCYAFFYIAFRPDGLHLLNTYVLQPLGIHTSHVSGSLIDGFTLHDLRSDRLRAKKVSFTYRLDTILKGRHNIERIAIDGLRIHLDDLKEGSDTHWPFPTFHLKSVTLTNLQLISDYPIEIDLHAKNGTYNGEQINFSRFDATFKSSYTSGALHGRLNKSSFKGMALLFPNHRNLASSSGRFTTLPDSVLLSVDELSDKQLKIHTHLNTLSFHQDPLLNISDINLSLSYRYETRYLDFGLQYNLQRDTQSAYINQRLVYHFDGHTHTTLNGEILSSAYPLPSSQFHADISDTPKGLNGQITLDGTKLLLSSIDYVHFDWRISSHHDHLHFLSSLPDLVQDSVFDLTATGSYHLENNDLRGTLTAHHNQADFHGTFSSFEGAHQLEGLLRFSPQGYLRTQQKLPLPEHMQLTIFQESNTTTLNLIGEETALSIASNDGDISGFGKYHGTSISLKGKQESDLFSLDVQTHTPSLFKTLNAIHPIHLETGEWFDAELTTDTHLFYDTKLHASGNISVPWYALTLDSQRAYGGVDNLLSYQLDGEDIIIDHYSVDALSHILTSSKKALLHLEGDDKLVVDEWWFFDKLKLNGSLSLNDLSARFHLYSDRFSYKGPEGSAHAKVDVTLSRDTEARHRLEGDILIQDALITYLPLQQFKVADDDIIIVQDVRPASDTAFEMNLRVTSSAPIHFKTKELDVYLKPEVTLWKDPLGPVQILGLLTLPSGKAKTAGKEFELSLSHIYFGGETPLNPYLDFTVSHEVDYKKLFIYITHRLDSPIFLFASDPVMSQNDIMSYLLFGSPANVTLNSDGSSTTARADATNFVLGAGLKEMIGGATKIQLDTMNILTTENGGMGFEVGTHINKDLRVLYKSDTVSSILVQYRLNRWLRLDADIHELGQGINAIYVQDFRDFLPHNEIQKK